jgi:hypothetical protein
MSGGTGLPGNTPESAEFVIGGPIARCAAAAAVRPRFFILTARRASTASESGRLRPALPATSMGSTWKSSIASSS